MRKTRQDRHIPSVQRSAIYTCLVILSSLNLKYYYERCFFLMDAMSSISYRRGPERTYT